MSRENVDLTRRGHDAFNRRDLVSFVELHDPAVEFFPYEVAVQGGEPYRGHDGVRSWWQETVEVLPDLRVEVHEVRDFGDRTFARGRLDGRGAGSGASFERALWQAFQWRAGKVVWWRAFECQNDAIKAAGQSD